MAQKDITKEESNEIQEAVEATVTETDTVDDTVLTTSTGFKVKALAVPSYMTRILYAQFPEPDPPKIKKKDGSRTILIENTNDPTYVEATQRRIIKLAEGMFRLNLLKGVEVLDIPKGNKPFEKDTGWTEDLELVGITIPDSEKERYILWLRTVVFPTTEDVRALSNACAAAEGIRPEEVQAELERFQDQS